MKDTSINQQDIINWFNMTYSQKGERYLRPTKAYYIFLELLNAQPGQSLLDVACGLGKLLEAAQEYQCQLHGIDVSEVAIKKARQKLPDASLQLANAESLPFGNNTFEILTCIGSLERMLDLDNVLKELLRVGSNNATYCFLVRNSNTLGWKLLKQKLGMRNKLGHQGAKTLTQWNAIFTHAGFEIISIHPDQYPLQKRRKWLSAGMLKANPRTLLNDYKPLEYANEFIYLLRKANK